MKRKSYLAVLAIAFIATFTSCVAPYYTSNHRRYERYDRYDRHGGHDRYEHRGYAHY